MSNVTEKIALSIVIPVYNEEESIPTLWLGIRRACEPTGNRYEVIFVDDGSRDKTFNVLKRLNKEDGRVKVIRFRKNFGQTAAMAAGFERASGDVIVSMDGDLQNDPDDIPVLLAKIGEGFDVVCGWTTTACHTTAAVTP